MSIAWPTKPGIDSYPPPLGSTEGASVIDPLTGSLADAAPRQGEVEGLTGTELFEQYLSARDKANALSKVEGARLADIKAQVGAFLKKNKLLVDGNYDKYDDAALAARWGGISDFLKKIAPDEVHAVEHEATDLYRRAAFKMYGETPTENGQKHALADGSFAFAVPIRMDRKHPEYGYEVESVLPLLRYVPEELRGQVVKGLPPSIIDVYERTEDGKRGYLVFTAVYGDEGIDLMEAAKPWRLALELARRGKAPTPERMKRLGKSMLSDFKERANQRIIDATNFATRRLGVDIVGLGAVLPGLSNFGRSLETDRTTTGHGGTVRLILDTLHEVVRLKIGRAEVAQKIGILGLGSIGYSIADVVAQDQLKGDGAADKRLIVYDKDVRKIEKVRKHLAQLGLEGMVEVARNEAELLEESDVAISAITSKLRLGKLRLPRSGWRGKTPLPGKRPNLKDLVIVDDGQPGSVLREDAERHGVHLVWVLGQGYNGTNELVRSSFRFGVDIKTVFGCEAEVAAMSAHVRRMRAEGATEEEVMAFLNSVVIRGPVSPRYVSPIDELFRENHIGPAPLQSYGQLLHV